MLAVLDVFPFNTLELVNIYKVAKPSFLDYFFMNIILLSYYTLVGVEVQACH